MLLFCESHIQNLIQSEQVQLEQLKKRVQQACYQVLQSSDRTDIVSIEID